MTADWRRLENPASGEAFTFVETSEETGGARVVALVDVQPGGGPRPHAHPPEETFELVNGVVELLHNGRRRRLEPGEPVTVPPGAVHTFTNPSDAPASVKVTIVPAQDFERVMRALAGLARDGRMGSQAGDLLSQRSWPTSPTEAATTSRPCRGFSGTYSTARSPRSVAGRLTRHSPDTTASTPHQESASVNCGDTTRCPLT